ncbi:MAG: phosphatidate cytidylyltransferase [Pseudomonadota bacterium]
METPGPESQTRTGSTRIRVLSSIALIPVAVLAIYLGGWPFTALVAVAGLIMVGEWAVMIDQQADGFFPTPGTIAAFFPVHNAAFRGLAPMAALAFVFAGFHLYALALLVAGSGGLFAFVRVYRLRGQRFWAAFGALYLIVPCVALVWLRAAVPHGGILTFSVFVVVWATDIAAFFAGRIIGGPKLLPAVSPKKTWSGTLCGVLAGSCAFVLIGLGFLDVPENPHRIGLYGGQLALAGVGLAIASIVGDMAESAMKRGFGVKDSGDLIPGHGGALDRLDGMIFATMAMCLTLVVYRFLQMTTAG